MRWNDDINAPIISKKESTFKGLEVSEENVLKVISHDYKVNPVSEENVLKVISHDYKVNPGLYMTPDDVREDIGGGRSELKKIFESLEKQRLIVIHRDRSGKVALVKSTYEGLQKAFPKEHYQWFPAWYDDVDKF
jgi:hypothetical protein